MADSAPCRLCLHELPASSAFQVPGSDFAPPGKSHIDLFVLRAPNAETLETYEIDPGFLRPLEEYAAGIAADFAGGLRLEIVGTPDRSGNWTAVRKADHRLHYWQYSGPIGPETGQTPGSARGFARGTLRELARGTLVGLIHDSDHESFFFRLADPEPQDDSGQ